MAGGLAILTGLLVTLLSLWLGHLLHLLAQNPILTIDRELDGRGPLNWAILGGAIGMTLLGAIDDRHDLRPAWKFSGQWAVATAVVLAGLRLPSLPGVPGSGALLCLLWILTVTNAVNFTDNMNGLCPGFGVVASAALGCVAASDGRSGAAMLAFMTCGALLGFLPWNFPRATVYLGDAGSHLVGFLLAVLACWPQPNPSASSPPPFSEIGRAALVLAVPLADLVTVILIRWHQGRPFYVGDTNHFSHLLVRRGLRPAQAVAILWAIAGVTGAAAVWWGSAGAGR